MEPFHIESTGMTRREFLQAVHRLARPFFLGTILLGAVIYLVICLAMGFKPLYLLFPAPVVAAILLFYEMKAFANYDKFDYGDAILHFRFEPDRWVIIRGVDLNTRMEFTWKETAHVFQTGKNLLLVPAAKGSGNYTLPKRYLTEAQKEAILNWFQEGRRPK